MVWKVLLSVQLCVGKIKNALLRAIPPSLFKLAIKACNRFKYEQ